MTAAIRERGGGGRAAGRFPLNRNRGTRGMAAAAAAAAAAVPAIGDVKFDGYVAAMLHCCENAEAAADATFAGGGTAKEAAEAVDKALAEAPVNGATIVATLPPTLLDAASAAWTALTTLVNGYKEDTCGRFGGAPEKARAERYFKAVEALVQDVVARLLRRREHG